MTDDYLKDRVVPQQKWFSKNSSRNKTIYYSLKRLVIVLAALIPFLAGFVDEVSWMDYLIGFLSILIVIFESFLTINKNHDKWISYRVTSEALKKETNYFKYQVKPYDKEDRLEKFVEKIEAILSSQNLEWLEAIKKSSQD